MLRTARTTSPTPNDRWWSTSTTRRRSTPRSTGGKAAALARGRTAGLSSLPGVVLTTAFSRRDRCRRRGGRRTPPCARRSSGRVATSRRWSPAARRSSRTWRRRRWPVSSSRSSASDGFDAFVAAVTAVLDSRQRAGAAEHPIAVLVQPLIEPALRRRDVRHRSGDRPHRPPGRERRSRAGPSRW